MLRPTPQDAIEQGAVRLTACFPLLPYANRIGAGRFTWDGTAHALKENFPSSPHPLHGVGWRRPWQLISVRERSCVLRLEHRPDDGDKQDWPFAFEAEQTISLGTTGLSVELSLVNRHELPAPLGLGLHPFFLRRSGEMLIFDTAGAWRNAGDMLPQTKVSGGLWDHAAGQRVGAQELDHDFFGWSGRARIESDRAPTVRLSATPLFSVLRVFTPAAKDFFAVEPVSHLTNAINRPPDAGAGMFCAAPGTRIAGSMMIDMDRPS